MEDTWDYHRLQAVFADFQEHLGNTFQSISDTRERQQAKERENELKSKELEERERRILRLESLEEENNRLRREFETLRSEHASLLLDSESMRQRFLVNQKKRAPSAIIRNYNEEKDRSESVPYTEYSDLAQAYCDLYQENETLIESYCVLASKHKRSKAKSKEWERLFERGTFEVMLKGEKVVFRRVGGEESSRIISIGSGIERGAESPALSDAARLSRRSLLEASTSEAPPGLSEEDTSSTQSQDPRWPVQDSPNISDGFSDAPTIVAVNSVRRKNFDANRVSSIDLSGSSRETGSPTRPVIVKSEPSSGSLDSPALHSNCPSGDMDQDEPSTPDLDRVVRTSNAENSVLDEAQQAHTRPPPNNEDVRAIMSPPPTGTKRRALQQLDKNIVALQRSGGPGLYQTSKRKKRDDRGAAAVPCIAEDGEEEGHRREQEARHTSNARTPTDASRHSSGGLPGNRLLQLLAQPARPKLILNRSTRVANKPAVIEQLKFPANSNTEYPKTPQGKSKHEEEGFATTIQEEPGEVTPEDEPFRARQPHKLGLEHFKINPARNQGLNYAFQEVVRNKAERKCLSGCVRPDCCGRIFRSLALEGRRGRPPIPEVVTLDSLDVEDRQLLEEYLGESKCILRNMSDKELRELLIDARAKQLADLFGRHRQAHERARSPPGFWRTDMPSTQELERDRELAKEMERIKVMEKYREAMRPGGLWVFADE
ncbi:hypothetical protein VTO42DRAFT_8216 [Malbranchea cinnamomea]